MATLKPVPFAVQTGAGGITQNSDERLINMFAEIPVSGRAKIIRRQRACLDAVYSVAGDKRCIEKHGDTHYCIIGNALYSFDGTTLNSLATLDTASGRCTMIFNDNSEIMISDGTNLVYYDGAIHPVSNPAAFTPGTLAYINGYGVIQEANSGRFYITAPNDFSAIDALDFATAESNPDNLVRVFVDHNELWLAGKETIEIWQDVGGTDFPFQPSVNAKIERGSAAAYSFAAEDNAVTFLGDDLIVYRMNGYTPMRISSYAVEEFLKNCSTSNIANAYAFIYTKAGNKFYTLTVPDEGTWQYNFATGLWNEAVSYNATIWDVVSSNGHRSDYVMTTKGICRLDPDLNQDEGSTVLRLARSAPGWADGRRITMPELFVDCEVGRAPIGVTAEVMLRVALDGETFGNIRTRSLGATGAYGTRAVFNGLGQGRKPVLELSASGDFRFVIMDALLNAQVGSS